VIVGQQYNGCSCVYHDDRGAAEAVTALMLERGCRRPAYHRRDEPRPGRRARSAAGLSRALRAAGLECGAGHGATAEFTMESGYEKAAELLRPVNRPDGIFCATDNIAAGAMQYCRASTGCACRRT
jgi:LacI family sucrose operon transcriptional repressor